ncbi:MAG TPA: cytochrome c biogenesis protein CcdA [Anaerolineae bacterium]|nr:cytochrome c biogenesis protein CcdA [Anaerolineae bacterium]
MKRGLLLGLSLVALLAMLASCGGVTSAPEAEGPVVRFYLFYGTNCSHCHEVMENYLPDVYKKYGAQVEHQDIDVWADAAKYRQFVELEGRLGVPQDSRGSVPALVIGDHVLIGSRQIPAELGGLIDSYLAQGGVDYPVLDGQAVAPTGSPKPDLAKVVNLAYFYSSGCQECDRVGLDLNYIEKTYPQVKIAKFDIEKAQALAEWLGGQLGVPENRRLESPGVYVGTVHLGGDELRLANLEAAVQKYLPTGSEAAWDRFDAMGEDEARQSLLERFRSLGVLTVLGAGLVNGLNPCAFVTIVFFLSYLAFMGRRGRDILIVGAMFTLGVFLSYLLAGLGLSRLLEPLGGVQATLKTWVFGITALLCLALAGISLHDYIKARQGKTKEMILKLSPDLRRQVNRVIREGSKLRAFSLVAFFVGAAVSLIQLTCTSPIYVGILFLINDVPEMKANAVMYLLLYNLAYIVPLVAIFALAYFGTTSQQLGAFIEKRTPVIKAATTAVFLVLAAWLVYSLLKLNGVA